uniref:Uncharacterized protein n=1 Tax=Acrobeloides nanus TaxID=290746 RepID=A0A914E2S4_9BILA
MSSCRSLLKFKNSPSLFQYSRRWVSRIPKQVGAFHEVPELSKFFRPPPPYEPLFYPILELKEGQIEDRIQMKEFEFVKRVRDPEPFLGKYTTLLQVQPDQKWLPLENRHMFSHTKLYIMGVETMIWERGRFLHETLEEMEKVLKTLQPDVVAVEAFSENRQQFDALEGRRAQYMMENNALIRYTGILEKAARLNQHVALIDRPRKTTLSRLLSLKLFTDYPNLMSQKLTPEQIDELAQDFPQTCPNLAADKKNAEFYRDLYATMKAIETNCPKIYNAIYREREICMTFALQRLFVEVTRKKLVALKPGEKYQPPIIIAFVDMNHLIGISKLFKERINEDEVLELIRISKEDLVLRFMQHSASKLANWSTDNPVFHAYYCYAYGILLSRLLIIVPLIAAGICYYFYVNLENPDMEKKTVFLRKSFAVFIVVWLVSRSAFKKRIPRGAY